MKIQKNEKRFKKVYGDTSLFGAEFTIIVDTQTGVNYLSVHDSYGTGVTPLLDSDGKPVVTKIEE